MTCQCFFPYSPLLRRLSKTRKARKALQFCKKKVFKGASLTQLLSSSRRIELWQKGVSTKTFNWPLELEIVTHRFFLKATFFQGFCGWHSSLCSPSAKKPYFVGGGTFVMSLMRYVCVTLPRTSVTPLSSSYLLSFLLTICFQLYLSSYFRQHESIGFDPTCLDKFDPLVGFRVNPIWNACTFWSQHNTQEG